MKLELTQTAGQKDTDSKREWWRWERDIKKGENRIGLQREDIQGSETRLQISSGERLWLDRRLALDRESKASLMPTHLNLLPGLLDPRPQTPFLAPESGRV